MHSLARGDTNAVHPQTQQTQLFTISKAASYAQAKAESTVAQDTQDLANTITAAFQTIIGQRPDLANANFDFTGGKDGIAVTSSTLSDDDRLWLEKQLNANTGLVDLVTYPP